MYYYYCVDIGNNSSNNKERERVNIHFLYLYIHRECVFIYAFAIHQRLRMCVYLCIFELLVIHQRLGSITRNIAKHLRFKGWPPVGTVIICVVVISLAGITTIGAIF